MDLVNKRAIINPEAIEEIIVANHIKDDHKKEIISIARDRFPHAGLLQAKYDFASDNYSFGKL